MAVQTPTAQLGARFSGPGAAPVPWLEARERLEKAEIYWLTTVRPDGRPHVTPLIAVWLDDALYFCTGPDERKAKNLEGNAHAILITGCNSITEGLDIVVEGDAVRLSDDSRLRRLANAYVAKYGEDWRFAVKDGIFTHPEGGDAIVFEVRPKTAFGFGKGDSFSQTRWRFQAAKGGA